MMTSTTSSPPSAFRFCLSGRKRRTQSPVSDGHQLPTIDAREQRRRAFPQDSSDRDLEYHRFCVSSGRTLLSSMAQSALARFVFANDLPVNTHQMVTKPEDVHLGHCSEFLIRTTDGELCHCYWLPAFGTQGVGDYSVLYLHGASGNIGHRLEVAKVIQKGISADVLLIDYRGFGRSSGQPSELGTYLDAQAGLDWILAKHSDHTDVKCNGCGNQGSRGPPKRNKKIVVFGTSLGAAIAMHLASQEDNARHLHAVVVENCFTSIAEISRYYVPNWVRPILDFVKSTLVCPMYDCLGKASRIRCPALYLVGSRDPVVPAWMSQILYSQTINSSRKAIREFSEGRHNDLPNAQNYTKAIVNFLEQTLSEEDVDAHTPASASTWRSVDDIANDVACCRDKTDVDRRDMLGRTTCSMLSLPLKSQKKIGANSTQIRAKNSAVSDLHDQIANCNSHLLSSSIKESGGDEIERHTDDNSDLSSSVQSRDQTDSSTSLAGSLTSSSSGPESLKSEDILADCNEMTNGGSMAFDAINANCDSASSVDVDSSILMSSAVTLPGDMTSSNFQKMRETSHVETVTNGTSKRSSKAID